MIVRTRDLLAAVAKVLGKTLSYSEARLPIVEYHIDPSRIRIDLEGVAQSVPDQAPIALDEIVEPTDTKTLARAVAMFAQGLAGTGASAKRLEAAVHYTICTLSTRRTGLPAESRSFAQVVEDVERAYFQIGC